MPDMLTIAAGLVEGVSRATENFNNVSLAMQDRERQKKIDDYSFKQADLQIKKDEEYLSPDMTQARQEQIKTKQKDSKAKFAMDMMKIRTMKVEHAQILQEKQQEQEMFTILAARMGETPQDEPVDFTGVLPQGTTHKIGRYSFKGGSAKVSKDEQLGNDVGAYERGEKTLKDLYKKYSVSKVDKKIDALLPPLPPDPRFKVEGGFNAWRSPHKAELNEVTIYELNRIKTKDQLHQAISNRVNLEAKGVDVDAIMEYHGDKLLGDAEEKKTSEKKISEKKTPRKTKFGSEYEQKEDGKWYKVRS